MGIKADYIITLVGKNPSPNYYSILNYADLNTKVYAVYTIETDNSISSEVVFNNIKEAVNKKIKKVNIRDVNSDRSSFIEIKKVVCNILNEILKECDYENLGSRIVNIILDYTGATKAMSTAFYSFFEEISKESKYEKLNISSSYISSDKEEVYQCSFNPVKLEYTYKIEEIFKMFKVTIEDLIELHGFKLVNNNDEISIVLKNNKSGNNKYKFADVDIEKSNLRFTVVKNGVKIKDLVDSYFEIWDAVEKVGGSEAFLTFKVHEYKFETGIEDYEQVINRFYDELKGIYSQDLRDKVEIIFED